MEYYDYIGSDAFDIFMIVIIGAMTISTLAYVYAIIASKPNTIKETTTITYEDGTRLIYEKKYSANVSNTNNK